MKNSKYKHGDKFIIEVEEIYDGVPIEGEELYRIKGFRSLVFDNAGLDKLKRYKDQKEAVEIKLEKISPGDICIDDQDRKVVVLTACDDGSYNVYDLHYDSAYNYDLKKDGPLYPTGIFIDSIKKFNRDIEELDESLL